MNTPNLRAPSAPMNASEAGIGRSSASFHESTAKKPTSAPRFCALIAARRAAGLIVGDGATISGAPRAAPSTARATSVEPARVTAPAWQASTMMKTRAPLSRMRSSAGPISLSTMALRIVRAAASYLPASFGSSTCTRPPGSGSAPSSTAPSGCVEPWPEKWMRARSPGPAFVARSAKAAKIAARVGAAAGRGASARSGRPSARTVTSSAAKPCLVRWRQSNSTSLRGPSSERIAGSS